MSEFGDLFEGMIDGLRTVITAALPDVAESGIARVEHAMMLNRQLPGSPVAQQALPYAAIQAVRAPAWEGRPLTVRGWAVPVTLYVVAEIEDDNAPLVAYVGTLADYLWHNLLPLGQVIPRILEPNFDPLAEPNATYFTNNERVRAGWLTFTVVVGNP